MSIYNKIKEQDLRGLQKVHLEAGSVVRTLKCKTVAVGKFRHENLIRDLEPYIVDEPPHLLGDDTAPGPSEALLAALGSCIAVGIQANLVHRGIDFRKISMELEGDIDISAVWGTGKLTDQVIGFSAVRLKVDLDSDLPPGEVNHFLEQVLAYSPVTSTIRRPIPVTFSVTTPN